jgi:hypothetical protein
MRTADKLKRSGDDSYNHAQSLREMAAKILLEAAFFEELAIIEWTKQEYSPCSSTAYSASPSV